MSAEISISFGVLAFIAQVNLTFSRDQSNWSIEFQICHDQTIISLYIKVCWKRAMNSNLWTERGSSDIHISVSNVLKAGVHFRNFSTYRKKNNFSETRKYFPRVGKNFKRAGKLKFCQERPGELKSYVKNFSQKTNAFWITPFAF